MAAIFGTVFEDLNGNGVRDTGEPGMGGQTVALRWFGYRETITFSDGNYEFGGLAELPYRVYHPAADGWLPLNSSADEGLNVDLTGREAAIGQDIPMRRAVLGGRVFLDANQDGVRQAGEAGFGEAAITAANAESGATFSTVSDGSGIWGFADLPDGTYTVTQSPLSGPWVFSTPPGGREPSTFVHLRRSTTSTLAICYLAPSRAM